MSLVTSCPQCATIFIVRPEQLAAQKGKVRCGNCQQVFNALDSLQEPVNITSSEQTVATVIEVVSTVSEEIVEVAEEVASSPTAAESINIEQPALPNPSEKTIAETPPKLNEVISGLLIPIDLTAEKEPLLEKLTEVAIEEERQQVRRRKVNKISLFLLSFLLVLIAAVQTIYFMRTSITAQWPILKPDFVTACKFIGCTIELPKDADLLTVDDSDLHEDAERHGLIHLTSTLINNANVRQSYPLMELTLTDANEAPVLRKTFQPQEYLPANSDVKAGLAPGEDVHINLALTAEEKSVTGYRVYLTY